MKKIGFVKRRLASDEMSLQITSMADIFIIILVFLLKGYAAGIDVNPTKGLLLPEAMAAEAPVTALKVEISENAVQVEGQPVATLEKFGFTSTDLLGNGSSKSLGASLEKERKRQLFIASQNQDVKVDPKIIVIADQRVPYATLKTVLASAALNGYTDFKLAVISDK